MDTGEGIYMPFKQFSLFLFAFHLSDQSKLKQRAIWKNWEAQTWKYYLLRMANGTWKTTPSI